MDLLLGHKPLLVSNQGKEYKAIAVKCTLCRWSLAQVRNRVVMKRQKTKSYIYNSSDKQNSSTHNPLNRLQPAFGANLPRHLGTSARGEKKLSQAIANNRPTKNRRTPPNCE